MNTNALDLPFGSPDFEMGNNFDGGVSATRSPQERKLDATYAAVDPLSLSINYITHKQSCWQCSSNRDLCTDGYRLCLVAGAVEEMKEGI